MVHGGGRGIRTPVPRKESGFQDRRLKPLGHPSLTIFTVFLFTILLLLCQPEDNFLTFNGALSLLLKKMRRLSGVTP